jgi:hypothetical protein
MGELGVVTHQSVTISTHISASLIPKIRPIYSSSEPSQWLIVVLVFIYCTISGTREMSLGLHREMPSWSNLREQQHNEVQ